MDHALHIVYLTTFITLSVKMLNKSQKNQYFKLCGLIEIILRIKYSFNLIQKV